MRYRESIPDNAERALVGSMLLNMDFVVEDAQSTLGETAEAFIDPGVGSIYAAIMELYRDGHPVDILTVCDKLLQSGSLEAAGGYTGVAEIMDYVPTSHNAPYYLKVMREDFVRRKLMKMFGDAGAKAKKPGADSQSIMQQIESEIYTMENQTSHGSIEHIGEILPRVLRQITEIRKQPNGPTGISTGVSKLDRLIDYLRPETLNILAARPGVGKSAIAINFALSAAKQGHPVLFLSLEMGRESIVRRFLSVGASTPWKSLANPLDVNTADRRIGETTVMLSGMPIKIIDSERMDMFRLRAKARRFSTEHGGKMPMIIIDYLQICVRGNGKEQRRHEAIGDFTRECKALSRELRCPFLLLSQISREGKSADSPFDAKDALKDSGNIEEDADTIMVMVPSKDDRAVGYAKSNCLPPENLLTIGVVKNREGGTGVCNLYFDKQTQAISELFGFRPEYHESNSMEAMEEEEVPF